MSRSRAYQTTLLKNVRLDRVLEGRDGQAVAVGCDISKDDIRVVLRWKQNDFERPWKVDNPAQIKEFVNMLQRIAETRTLELALEPTGTYGDSLRHQLQIAGISTSRVSPKAAHDYAEIFDAVPSKHDGKDAAVIAELHAIGKSKPWTCVIDPWEQELASVVNSLETNRRLQTIYYGNLEGLVSRHWPEASGTLKLASGVLLRCLAEYGGPVGLAQQDDAEQQLVRWGRGRLDPDKARQLVEQSAISVGVPQTAADVRRVQRYASDVVAARREGSRLKRSLEQLAEGHEVLQRQGRAVGIPTACVLWVHLGDPRQYDSAGAYRKAMGLNLKTRSSGRWNGCLKITKRGSSAVRRWMYFASLRLCREDGVRQWYQSHKSRAPVNKGGSASKWALMGIQRKLALALHCVGVGAEFDARRLFDPVEEAA